MNLRIASTLIAVLAVQPFVACRSTQPVAKTQASEAPVRPGQYLIRFPQVPDPQKLTDALLATSSQLLRSYELVPGLVLVSSPLELEEMKQILDTKVESVSPNRLLFPTASAPQAELLPNDPKFSLQWGLRNVGQAFNGLTGSKEADIRAPQGWAVSTRTKLVIAVLDTGINTEHEDLASNLWVNEEEASGIDGEDDDDNGYVDDVNGWNFVTQTGSLASGAMANGSPNVRDFFGHGTEVASILGASGENTTGITGVAWDCRIMPLRIFSMNGHGMSTDVGTAIAALEYAVNEGVKISSNSWGAYPCGDPDDFHDLSLAIENAGRCGHLFVASAGNAKNLGTDNDTRPFVPGSFPLDNIVAVTSIGYNDELPGNVNYGLASVDLAAPGLQILTADQASRDGYRFVAGGTSYAVPHVAAAAALLWDLPGWNVTSVQPKDVRDHLIATARPVASLAGKAVSGGVLNLGALLGSPRPPEGVPVEATQPR